MTGTWNKRLRALHTWLGVFFSPLLLLFTITGWWQTFADEDTPNHGAFNHFLSRLSNIHTADYFREHAGNHPPSQHFKLLVGTMAVALIVSIFLGLILACRDSRRFGRTALAFALGVAVPALILYFA